MTIEVLRRKSAAEKPRWESWRYEPRDRSETAATALTRLNEALVAGVAAVLTALAIMRLFVKDTKARLGLSAAMIPAALLSALFPGRLISLCMMPAMRCRAVMSPAVTVLSVLIIAAAGIDVAVQHKKV